MRAVGLHEDVIAVTSRAYATGCVLVRNGGEAFCIDSPVFPDELEILPAIAEQAGFSVVGVQTDGFHYAAPRSLAASRSVFTSAVGFFWLESSVSLLRLTQITGTFAFRHGSTS